MLRPQSAFAFLLVLTSALVCAACDPAPSTPEPAGAPAAETPAAPTPPPMVDRTAAERFVHDGGALEVPDLPASGDLVLKGTVRGYAAPTYAFALAAGQTIDLAFEPSNTNLYFNVSDASDASGAALHRGEVDGAKAVVTATHDMTLVVAPFQPRAMARRDETGDYVLTVSRR